jgi:hypothetical protein
MRAFSARLTFGDWQKEWQKECRFDMAINTATKVLIDELISS